MSKDAFELGLTNQSPKPDATAPTFTLDLTQLANLVDAAYTLGTSYCLDAVINAGYAADKRDRIQQHVDHHGAALNDLLAQWLQRTPEVQKQLQSLRPIEE